MIMLHTWPSFHVPGHSPCFSATPFGIKVQRILNIKRIPYAVKEVAWHDSAETVPKLSASKKLPVLDYNGHWIEDSTQIAFFLEEKHSQMALIPSSPAMRAHCHFIEEWADEVLYRYRQYGEIKFGDPELIRKTYYGDYNADQGATMVEKRQQGLGLVLNMQGFGRYPVEKFWAEFRRSLQSLNDLIQKGGYLAGPALTLADIAVFAQLHRSTSGADPWYEDEVARFPDIRDWVSRIEKETSKA
jgi:glutathione S-transferase